MPNPRLFLTALAIMGIVPAGASSMGLRLERTVALDSTPKNLRAVEFSDVDRDGTPELLLRGNSAVVIYSLTGDSIVARIAVDSLSFWGQVFADVNRDSVADIVLAYTTAAQPPRYLEILKLYDGARQFQLTAIDTIATTYYGWGAGLAAGLIGAADLDRDGYSELVVSVDSGSQAFYVQINGVWTEVGHSIGYYHFPDSIAWRAERFLLSLDSLSVGTEMKWYGEAYYYGINHTIIPAPSNDTYTYSSGLVRVTGSTETPWAVLELNRGWCSVPDLINEDFMRLRTTGDIDGSKSGCLLAEYWKRLQGLPLCSAFADSLQLYRYIDDSTIERLWSVNLGLYPPYTGHFYHPQFPGHFMAFSLGKLVMFDGLTGLRSQDVIPLPSGTVSWQYCEPDGIPRLVAVDGNTISFYLLDDPTAVPGSADDRLVPGSFVLSPVYPNPFNSATSITFDLVRSQQITVRVYDLLGREVATLLDTKLPAGRHRISWDGANSAGNQVASGVYLFQVATPTYCQAVKGLLLK